jgi:hypothetical protein
MLLVIGVYIYKVLLLTLLASIPNRVARHLKQHKVRGVNLSAIIAHHSASSAALLHHCPL